MAKLGIDFGTSNTTIAWVDPKTGRPNSFRIEGEEKIPSVIYFAPEGTAPIVGPAAFAIYEMANDILDPIVKRETLSGVISGIKRDMDNDSKVYLANGSIVTYVELLAIYFDFIKKAVELSLKAYSEKITEVCITHPVDFSEEKKGILKDAAQKAGFLKVKLLQEPVAASMGYVADESYKGQGILVYDFGGGTFDLAYVKFDSNGDRYMLPPLGDSNCGGENIDLLLYNEWDKKTVSVCGRHIAENEYEVDLSFLKKTCEHQKRFLSDWHKKTDDDYKLRASRYGKPLEMIISKKTWETMLGPIVDRTISLTGEMINQIKSEKLPLDRVILIGGSSRIPLVSKRLKDEFGIVPDNVPEQDIAVALGALSFISESTPEIKVCYCRKCGTQLTSKMKFCNRCGKDNFRYNHRFD